MAGKNWFEALRHRARRLPAPVDYLAGRALQRGFELPFSILCFCRKKASLLLRHSGLFHRDHHHRQVLLVALEGDGEICIDDRVERLEEGAAILIAPYQFHHYLSFSSARITWLYITFELQGDHLVQALANAGPMTLSESALLLVRQFLKRWSRKSDGPQLSLLLGALLCELAEARRARARQKVFSQSELLSQINALVLQRSCYAIKELAAALDCSESHLRSRFRLETGLSLGRHIRQLRLQKACSLLVTSSLRIQEISEACRFNSIFAFSRSFREGVGVSPSQYRRRQQKYVRSYGS